MVVWLSLLVWLAVTGAYAQEQCPQPLGNADQTGYTATDRDDVFFLLDVNHPAKCDGTVSLLSYCVYNPQRDGEDRVNEAFVAVFTQTVSSGMYTKKSEFVTLSQMIESITNNFVFGCFTVAVTFDVQEGDVFGVCQIDPSGGSQRLLNVVGTGGPQNTSLYVAQTTNDGCMQTNQVDINSGGGSFMEAYVLHVHANIATMNTEAPTTPSATTVETSSPTTEMPTTVETSSPTTEMPTTVETSSPTTEMPTTVDSSNPTTGIPTNSTLLGGQSAGGSIAAIAASLVVAVLFVIFITVAVAAAVYVVARRKNRKDASSRDLNAVSSVAGGMDNLIYEAPGNADNEYYEAPPASSHQHRRETVDTTLYEEPLHMQSLSCSNGAVFPLLYENASAQKDSKLHSIDHITDTMVEPIYEDASLSTAQTGQRNEYFTLPSRSDDIYAELLQQNTTIDIYADQSPYYAPATEEDELYGQIEAFGSVNINWKQLKVVRHLGSGQFGSVDQGVWRRPNDSAVDVALKTLNEGASEQDKVRFLQEGAIMAQFRHPNVVLLHGIVCNGGPVTLVVELVEKGDLREFLLAMRSDPGEMLPPDTALQLLQFSQQVALGMQYLTSKAFVHRDLAARNILVSGDNICKVADFGMSRDLADEQYYVSHGGKIPVKWTAPEALHFKKYSTASDVWSYGCLLYEIWSIGHKPFEGMTNSDVLTYIESGYRLPPPPGCPRRVYELMIAAWHPESSRRPGFRDLLLGLVGNEGEVLSIPNSHKGGQAVVLGAPLRAAETLYPDLQNFYK